MEPSYTEMFYGAEFAAKLASFQQCMGDVESRHQAYFDSVTSKFAKEGEERPARLSEFYIHQYSTHNTSIGFTDGLPDYIIDECLACFNKYFNDT